MLNKQNKNKIDYVNFTWNVISGCLGPDGNGKHCNYCYLKSMDKRFGSNLLKPMYNPERFKDLKSKKLKPGDKIFVSSSGDMWGDWVSAEHIKIVLNEIEKYPQYDFLCLTKNPKRYYEFDIPENCYAGVTIDTNDRAEKFYKYEPEIDFISFEPLMTDPSDLMINWIGCVNWIIIGGESGAAKKPDAWADKLVLEATKLGVPIWVKDNLKYHTRLKEWYK